MTTSERDIVLWLNKTEARLLVEGLQLHINICGTPGSCSSCETARRIINYLLQEVQRK